VLLCAGANSRANGLPRDDYVWAISILPGVWPSPEDRWALLAVAVADRSPARSRAFPPRRITYSESTPGLKRPPQAPGDRPYLTVIGIYWFRAVLITARSRVPASPHEDCIMIASLAMGRIGSLVAGGSRQSGTGPVPLPIGTGLCGAVGLLDVWWCCVGFVGFWPVHQSSERPSDREGQGERRLTANNFVNTIGAAPARSVLPRVSKGLRAGIILIFGIFTILATIYVASQVSDFLARFLLWSLTNTVYRIRLSGQENVPLRGPALLVANHVSFVDGFLIGACVQRFVRYMVHEAWYERFRWFFKMIKTIPVPAGTHKSVVIALRRARQQLIEGHVVCIFAEGSITRTGNMLSFHRGLEKIIEDWMCR
jgi:acyl-[acyl-carrier-protein]-phospholipid O-acyltransferase/long-chain-fatty-acid--[acyl-carrier-protein] ligase